MLTEEPWRSDEWPYDVLDGVHYVHSLVNRQHVINVASYMVRGVRFDLIIPLDEYDVQTAGVLREHFVLPGLTASEAHPFNDKLAMRVRTKAAGIPSKQPRASAVQTSPTWLNTPPVSIRGWSGRAWKWPACALNATLCRCCVAITPASWSVWPIRNILTCQLTPTRRWFGG
uniref:hypothetical protein n=1 Tax=Candidatus Roseilinea sp. TaxID=2838777 RepID=UPI004049A55F